MTRVAALASAILLFSGAAFAQPASSTTGLRIVSAGPTGEIAKLEQANDIRVVFSESMVALGQVPPRVRPSYVHVSPAVEGAFRWSGTSILIFTPSRPLPAATRYDVRIDAGVAALSGRRLASPYVFSFTTPTVHLLETTGYRKGGRFDAPLVIALRFNQPVRASDIARHTTARDLAHPWTPPSIDPAAQARLRAADPNALQAFDAKVRSVSAAAASTGPVTLTLAADWDKKRYPPARDLVVFETASPVAPESWVQIRVDAEVPSPAGPAVPGAAQAFTIEVEHALFASGFQCGAACDPDGANPIGLTVPVKVEAFAAATTATDVTDPQRSQVVAKAAAPKPRESWQQDESTALTLEDAGFDAQPPARTYGVTIAPTLTATDGQTLGYTWAGTVENWHQRAFTSFGDGDGVWETGGGPQLPFYARNFLDVTQWATAIDPAQLMDTLRRLQAAHFHLTPSDAGLARRLGVTPDKIQSHGLDISKALKPNGTGLVWAAVQEGQPIAHAKTYQRDGDTTPILRASLVQVTNLGISVKDSPANTLVFVTRLDNGAPVAGATVSIVKTGGQAAWRGATDADGIAIAPRTRLRNPNRWWEFAFIVTAEKDGDVAYVGSDWNEGVQPWNFGAPFNLEEADPLLRGRVFTDRGVYRPGEAVHFKAILRANTAEGVRLLPAGTKVVVTTRDTRNKVVDERTLALTPWSSAEWTFTLPGDGALGSYSVRTVLASDRASAEAAKRAADARRAAAAAAGKQAEFLSDEESTGEVSWLKSVNGSFLVAAYRRPDFRVDVTLGGDPLIAGTPLKGVVAARYLFGAPMGRRPAHWTFSKTPVFDAPSAISAKFPEARWVFVGTTDEEKAPESGQVAGADAQLGATGELPLDLHTKIDAGVPYAYTLEGDVEDVSRQHIASRTSVVVHPAPWYVGVRRPSYFTEQRDGLKTELVVAGLDGAPVSGLAIDVTLTQIQWTSVRRAEGDGFYTWDSERKEVPAGHWQLTSGSGPVPLDVPLPAGGEYVLAARANGADGRYAVTRTEFYALGSGYTAWARYDNNRIDLVPERTSYQPGETARIMIQSPWERATALVTTEREGIRTHRQFALTSTQQSIDVPIAADDIPNLFVSVLLVKGRTVPAGAAPTQADPSDPGKPAFRLGYVQLRVEDASKRLAVAVEANKQEYRPANSAHVTVDVKDAQGRGSASEVTLWAVDYGVLSLTAFKTPDVLDSVYVRKSLQVLNEDTRQRIVSRRVLTPKGETDGGGGGIDAGPGTMRRDFRVLAFWLGSVATDRRGHSEVDVELPESLTTYRIMAVAADRASRFGSADTEIRINKPVTLKPAFPRFLAVGDKSYFGAVITNQLPAGGPAVVTMTSLDPGVLQFAESGPQTIDVPAGGSVEARFHAAGRAIGRARVRMTVELANERDAFEDVVPVEVLASPETVAVVGQAGEGAPAAAERVTIPEDVVAGFGGLHVDLASTALVGLGDGARYLVEYPYGCAEQRASRALALLLAADLGDAFTLPGIDPSQLRRTVQQALTELEKFQCESGGFAYWPGDCRSTSAYLTAYLLHVFKVAADSKYAVDPGMQERAYTYLQQQLAQKPPENESWWPAYTAWQAFAVKVLVEGGRNQDSNITRLYGYRDRMPVFALAYLHDALVARGETSGAREADLRHRIGNAILPEAATAHVEELNDPYLLWYWNSNVRSTAIVLNSLVRGTADSSGRPDETFHNLVAWLMQARQDGRWGNTQENAMALEALVNYYRRFEATVPDFRAVVTLGSRSITTASFTGRSTIAKTADVPMTSVIAAGKPGTGVPLLFTRDGQGTLFYSARLRYAMDRLFQQTLDAGIRVERTYAPYVEKGTQPAATSFKAGDLIRVTLTVQLTKEGRYVAVTDPLPAGFEPVESWFATTAASLTQATDDQGDVDTSWQAWWQHGGFDHVERHDDRVELFATRLSEGRHDFSYVVRATTAGVYRTAPAHAEEMYSPEVFGRTATAVIEVK